jgi:hypothetical protein
MDPLKFAGGRIGYAAVFSRPDKVKVLPEEGAKNFSQGRLKFFHNNSRISATAVS